MTTRPAVGFALTLLCLASAGCLRLERERPEKRHYLIEAKREGESHPASAGRGMLHLRRFNVNQAFESPSFVYRTGESSWEADYYNAFFVSPDVMLSEQVSRWLRQSGLFSRVATRGSQVRADYLLEGNVISLHGDYRDPGRPEAVIEIEILLLRDNRGDAEILSQGEYRVREPVGGDRVEDLVAAWGRALASVLREAESDLADALAESPETPS